MDQEKTEAYAALAAQLMELHASVALLAQNVEKMARTDEEVTSMTRIFNGVCVPCARVNWPEAGLTDCATVAAPAGLRTRRSRRTTENRLRNWRGVVAK
ncbi:hypothetical protein PF005_g2839 [Phytophthora fragariae]|uniref:Uncharacterized protein n=1 Tax=Phytophthora fragariae TaxID=53985 RepID=A0A6A3TFX7_9STRA|nr:hypothetical protein PF003_g27199 [Phytophthora fragariae]KAE8947380.1 hypothetical protein PF009_g3024 [Phytophthora fragariae]KAE9134800.1 hypothetical protein PF007_g2794 [Phytophthora fragariae]KAE9135107.1 hypothetical protein PF010_g2216 [Phytophthora fragariae]KAE9153540.1 hypothetical protein PF006_g2357 [Phytophthora fragariae]